MKIKLIDKKMDNAFSYRGFSIEDFNSLDKGGVVEVSSIPKHAKEYVKDLLENSDEGKFSIISHGRGKYGRVLGELFVKGHEKSVNELLKENGHAYEYDGGKKKIFGS